MEEKVIAVGTTSCRTLETLGTKYGKVIEDSGWTDILCIQVMNLRLQTH